MQIVLKIGGSILFNDGELNIDLISKWVAVIDELVKMDIQLGVVVGGGIPARKFISAANKLGANATYQDILGIQSARQNARLFISALKEAYPDPPGNYKELLLAFSTHKLVICGGFQPGQSTNAVAAIMAEYIGADFLMNLTKVEKVYNKDPSKYDDAISYDNLTYNEFTKIVGIHEQTPGNYELFDHLGLEIVRRSSIKLVFIDGLHPEYVFDVIKGKTRGTIVVK